MDEYFYETGSTKPPKSRVWFVGLLVLLIFIGGIITAMGILNIKLWNTFSSEGKETVTLRFSREETSAVAHFDTPQTTDRAGLGVVTETVSDFSQAYYDLPQGVFFPHVPAGTNAADAGIQPGDILVALDGHKITSTKTLNKYLRRYKANDTVKITLYRDGQNFTTHLVLTQGE